MADGIVPGRRAEGFHVNVVHGDGRVILLTDQAATPPAKARHLSIDSCQPVIARVYVRRWHSRLPQTQAGPWKLAFVAHHEGTCYGAALWHNPSGRMLPQDWLELRRLAVPETAPPHAASWMLGAMRKWIGLHLPGVPRLVSYQDMDVHTGTIYKAAGWTPAFVSKPRQRDRTPNRVGTTRKYRSDLNGADPSAAAKTRWEIDVPRCYRPQASAFDLGAEQLTLDGFGVDV